MLRAAIGMRVQFGCENMFIYIFVIVYFQLRVKGYTYNMDMEIQLTIFFISIAFETEKLVGFVLSNTISDHI